ncbi:MAG: GtrA family protein [Lentisphaerae bacterium]|nr:GtrA family protein [Lentisphaerota bacterium]
MLIDPAKFPVLRNLSETQYQALAYLATGAWNTLFGIGIYSVLYQLFGKSVHYMILAVPANILAITNAFLCYKLFVFRTKGNWIKEYFKCYIVYGTGTLSGMFLLWLLVKTCCINPVAANIIATGIVVAVSFFGHKYFSFKK